ncbi:MAG: aminopeptidase [archaeon]
MPLDLRTRKLAKLAVNYCVEAKKGHNVIISGDTESIPFLVELYKEIILIGAHPHLRFGLPNIADFFYKYASKEQIEKFPKHFMNLVEDAQAYIGIQTDLNTREMTSVDTKKILARQKVMKPVSDHINERRDKIKRVSIAYPCMAHAIEADMSFTEYENFVYKSCLIDWKKLGKRLDKVAKKFRQGKEVYLLGENVDLRFKIRGKQLDIDKGEENMPGGEIFMAPVRESLNGWIKFEYPAVEAGKEVTDIFLKFENGKAVEAKASKNEAFLKEMLATDENASYVGEFGIGCNPGITKFTKNLLFDEKIDGTIHLALGRAYKKNGGGNDSAIHWDIVKDMKKAKIILDGKVVQENGKWKI